MKGVDNAPAGGPARLNVLFLAIITDLVLINLGYVLSYLIRYGDVNAHPSIEIYRELIPYIAGLHLMALALARSYRRRFASSWIVLKNAARGIITGSLLVFALVYAFRTSWGRFPTGNILLALGLNLVLVTAAKLALARTLGMVRKNVRFLDAGDLDDFILSSSVGEYDEIVLTSEIGDTRALFLLLGIARDLDIRLSLSPDLYERLLSYRIHDNQPVYFLFPVFLKEVSPIEAFLIRALDVAVSLGILIFLAPLMALVAVLIRLTSPGPVIYRQRRLGLNGRPFSLKKFRTMVKNAEELTGPVWAEREDPRVTRIGRILRRTRMDELPQFFNVLRGEMSLVGPRPERAFFIRQYPALSGIRLSVKPGLTGLAQIRAPYDLKPEHKFKYDFLYIRNRSLALNLGILLRTAPVLFRKMGW